jgi:hypothetical protein
MAREEISSMFATTRRAVLCVPLAILCAVVHWATMPARAAHPIKVGFGMALTGAVAPNGKQNLLALEIWRDDVNAKGGLLGRPVELVYYAGCVRRGLFAHAGNGSAPLRQIGARGWPRAARPSLVGEGDGQPRMQPFRREGLLHLAVELAFDDHVDEP